MSNIQKIDLASTTNITTTFAGKYSAPYITPAIFNGKTLNNQLVNIHINNKSKLVLPTGTMSDLIMADTCDWNPGGTLTLDQITMTLDDFQAQFQQCASQLEDTWESLQMTAGALNTDLPSSFQEFVIGLMIKRVAQENEMNLWRGNFTGISASLSAYTKYTGILRRMDTDANVIKIAKSGATPSTILNHLSYIFQLIPNEVREEPDFMWYCSTKTLTNYRLALAQGNYVNQFDQDRGNRFMNFVLTDVPGMPDDVMALGRKQEFHLATDLVSDFSTLRYVDSRFTVNDDNIRIKMRFKIATAVSNGAQLILVR